MHNIFGIRFAIISSQQPNIQSQRNLLLSTYNIHSTLAWVFSEWFRCCFHLASSCFQYTIFTYFNEIFSFVFRINSINSINSRKMQSSDPNMGNKKTMYINKYAECGDFMQKWNKLHLPILYFESMILNHVFDLNSNRWFECALLASNPLNVQGLCELRMANIRTVNTFINWLDWFESVCV